MSNVDVKELIESIIESGCPLTPSDNFVLNHCMVLNAAHIPIAQETVLALVHIAIKAGLRERARENRKNRVARYFGGDL